jgi:hypothetical protein
VSKKNYFAVEEEIYNNVGQQFYLSQSFNYTQNISFTKNGSKQRSIVSVYGLRTGAARLPPPSAHAYSGTGAGTRPGIPSWML